MRHLASLIVVVLWKKIIRISKIVATLSQLINQIFLDLEVLNFNNYSEDMVLQ